MSKKKKIEKLAKKDRPYKNILKQRDERFDYDDKGNVQGFQTRVSQKDKLLKARYPSYRKLKKGTKEYYDPYMDDADSRNLSNRNAMDKISADYLVDETKKVMHEKRMRKLRKKK